MSNNIPVPIIARGNYYIETDLEDLQIQSSCDLGPLFIDGLAEGIFISNQGNIPYDKTVSASFAILQAARARISRTEYISCPGCGRTLFDLEKTLKAVKERTANLKGLKIAVMGCSVNGPGEMADADFGYVGAGPGKVHLYKGKTIVKKNLPEQTAVDELVALINETKKCSC